MAPLSDWPQGYASHVVTTWMQVEHEQSAMREREA